MTLRKLHIRDLFRLVLVAAIGLGCSRRDAEGPATISESPKSDHATIWRSAGGGWVSPQAFSPNGSRNVLIAPSDKEGKLQIAVIDAVQGKRLFSIDRDDPCRVCFSPDGAALAALSYKDLTLYQLDNEGAPLRIVLPHSLEHIGFANDGRRVVGRFYGKLMAWNAQTGEQTAASDENIEWYSFREPISQDGKLRAHGGFPGGTPRISRVDGQGSITHCYRKPEAVCSEFSPDSREFLTVHTDGVLVVWEIRPTGNDNARVLRTLRGFENCESFILSPDSKRIAWSDSQGKLYTRPFASE